MSTILLDFFHDFKYNILVGFFRQEGGVTVQYIISFVMAVMARVVGDYVSKWLDSHKSDK